MDQTGPLARDISQKTHINATIYSALNCLLTVLCQSSLPKVEKMVLLVLLTRGKRVNQIAAKAKNQLVFLVVRAYLCGLIPICTERHMARVTVEDCVDKVPNRFELVMLAAHRAREISTGASLTVDRDNDKNPVVSLREIADEAQSAEDLRERMIESHQTQIEVDEPEEDAMALLMGAETDKPAEDDLSEEKLLRALMEAQRQP